MFLVHILGVSTTHAGIFGETAAYYGTVEQQGRLTSHLHLLLWIASSLSPQEIRDKLTSQDSKFQKALIDYLESVHRGEFLTGPLEQVRLKVPNAPKKSGSGIHEIIENNDGMLYIPGYKDPTQTLPEIPPPLCKTIGCMKNDCPECMQSNQWGGKYEETVDDILLRSNMHTCKPMYNDDTVIKPTDTTSQSAIKRSAYRGCQNREGECVKRFPRDTFPESTVDPNDGHLDFKKLESMMNTITPELSYAIRANTDVTSLLSGTAVKAVVAYVSDYITKQSLKTHQIFGLLADIMEK
ncbi:hypothetical protein K435DRAFT_689982, partial [Dendrothele bispora CBS 962.96]